MATMEYPLPDKLRTMRYRFINLDGSKIFCRDTATDTSPTLLLLPSGAEPFRRDNSTAGVTFFDAGHFALETHHTAIGAEIREFLRRRGPKQAR
jgi:hypothetical protein